MVDESTNRQEEEARFVARVKEVVSRGGSINLAFASVDARTY